MASQTSTTATPLASSSTDADNDEQPQQPPQRVVAPDPIRDAASSISLRRLRRSTTQGSRDSIQTPHFVALQRTPQRRQKQQPHQPQGGPVVDGAAAAAVAASDGSASSPRAGTAASGQRPRLLGHGAPKSKVCPDNEWTRRFVSLLEVTHKIHARAH